MTSAQLQDSGIDIDEGTMYPLREIGRDMVRFGKL